MAKAGWKNVRSLKFLIHPHMLINILKFSYRSSFNWQKRRTAFRDLAVVTLIEEKNVLRR